MESFEHIVVGGGSSGCVAAARLASDGGARVLLLEGGHSHRHPLLDMPPGIFKMINGSKFMRFHTTTPQAHLNGRRHDIPQANVLGGGSSVNAQVYIRGRPADYDEWQQILYGCNDGIGWGWNDVLPHFRRMEGNNRLHDAFHGDEGPLLVSDPGHIDDVSRWFVQAVQSLGLPFNADFNGPQQRGVGFYQFMNRRGRRSSAAYAYLQPQEHNSNLTIRLQSRVSKIIVEQGRARGVTYRQRDGQERTVWASGEIILAAGALVTPQILMLSGLGPAKHLAEHDIACLADLPGVGQNLIDHPEVPMTAIANGPYGYFRQDEGWRMLLNGLQFKLFGSGRVTSSGVEAGAYVNPVDPDAPPTVQAFCVPVVYLDRDSVGAIEKTYGVTVTTVVVRPSSRGEVRLASADPSVMPLVSPNLLKDAGDMATMIAGQRFFLRAFAEGPLARRISRIAIPTPNADDAMMATHCKKFVKTNYHPVGTARMGADGDRMAVLDSRMRVRGIDGLRVCDMSAVPNIPSGNTNAPAMMLGDRLADFVMRRQ